MKITDAMWEARQMLLTCRAGVEMLAVDALGVDDTDGHSYRDEMLAAIEQTVSNLEAALAAAPDATGEPDRRLSGVLIWSGEHFAWWRPNGAGYTTQLAGAGVYERAEAVRLTHHCGPEKKIEIQELAEQVGLPDLKGDTVAARLLAPPQPSETERVEELVEALEDLVASYEAPEGVEWSDDEIMDWYHRARALIAIHRTPTPERP